MGSCLVFSLPDDEMLRAGLASELGVSEGLLEVREFPDGESYVRCKSSCEGRDVIFVANLFQPNSKILPLLFCTRALRDAGAARLTLVSPYLPYMRQDVRFNSGEIVSAGVFAQLLSSWFDGLVTVDPHLHRYNSLSDIYTIPTVVEHSASAIATWILNHVVKPIVVGPDSESEQWVREVADLANAPHMVLSKIRHGDRDVEVKTPDMQRWHGYNPVVVDDIASTAQTLVEVVSHLLRAGCPDPVCIAVHAVFAGNAYEALKRAGASDIVTCNTIPHPSNAIDLMQTLADGTEALLEIYASQFLSTGEQS